MDRLTWTPPSGRLASQSSGSVMACRFDCSTPLHVVTSHAGIQEMAWQLKGKIAKCDHREYGFAQINVSKIENGTDVLFEGLGDEFEVRRRSKSCTIVRAHLGSSSGLDVPWGSTFRDSRRLPCHRAHIHCPLRIHRPQRQTVVWDPVPPRGHPLSTRAGGHRKVRSRHLPLFYTLDHGQ